MMMMESLYHFSDVRMEEFVMDKLEKKKRDRFTNTELLGLHMIDAGNEFGPGTSYGEYLSGSFFLFNFSAICTWPSLPKKQYNGLINKLFNLPNYILCK